ncbi:hypothetical protein [Tropicimonas sp. IMCC6043]|uniref:hypothetical protein n=1 Tax=Tropicimonas sp. IMCC6043 TaxID=2510645 RepID=UPI00101CDB48|nr:hypothetical protein [Tropicimonas sp. IMCC6043]RYH06118.1 hypothetical protein EU800_24950 [Tropicimonas sp. IMCC6043]
MSRKITDIQTLKKSFIENDGLPAVDIELNKVVVTAAEVADLWCVLDYLDRQGTPAPRLHQIFNKLADKQHKQYFGSNAMSNEEVRRRGIAIGIVEIMDAAGEAGARKFATEVVGCSRDELRKWINASKDSAVPENRLYRLSVRSVADRLRHDVKALQWNGTKREAILHVLKNA